MTGKREQKTPKGQMARRLVYYCLSVLTGTTLWAMVISTVAVALDRTIDLSAVLTFVGAAFGGELLLLLVKRVFAKEKTNSEEEEIEWNS